MEENSCGESVEEVSPTQNDVIDRNVCEQTQQEIQYAELLYKGSLLQDSTWPESIKVPLPTASGREVLVLFGRQEKGGPAHNIFVMLYDRSRNNKQPASRHHSILRLNLEEGGQLSASLQDLHSYITRFTVIIEPTGQSIQSGAHDTTDGGGGAAGTDVVGAGGAAGIDRAAGAAGTDEAGGGYGWSGRGGFG